jgi:hypothetical protein
MAGTPARQCHFIKPNQSRCQANTINGSEFCFFHDPASAAARDAARSDGGRERSRKTVVLPADTPDKKLSSAADVTALLAETINQVRRGEVDTRISNAVGYLAGVLLQAQNRDELEQRLARLESVIASQPEDARSTTDTIDEDFARVDL